MSAVSNISQAAKIEELLAQLRQDFLVELPERCDRIEELTLGLERHYEREQFNALYREVHSIKGSGGTHGLHIITAVCHQLENRLNELNETFSAETTSTLLAHVDLLREVAAAGIDGSADYSVQEERLEKLAIAQRRDRRSVLVAESSRMMQGMYKKVLAELPLELTVVDDGFSALQLLLQQRFDYLLLARELKGLNGIAVMAALRASLGKNENIPAVMVTSNQKDIPPQLHIHRMLARDQHLGENLAAFFETTS